MTQSTDPRSAADILAKPNPNRNPEVTQWLKEVAEAVQTPEFWNDRSLPITIGA
ncbi:MAG: hypothetical protein ABSB68_15540 [Acidimicrobiales bacterium]|jgi:hypothetical protein